MKKQIVLRVLGNFRTTVIGIATGAVTGAAAAIYAGQMNKEAVIAGAAIGAAGAWLKDPEWMKRILPAGNK